MKQAPTEPVYNGRKAEKASDSCKYPGLSVVKALSCMVLLAGGYWGDSSDCGSRCRDATNSLSIAVVNFGARGHIRQSDLSTLEVKRCRNRHL